MSKGGSSTTTSEIPAWLQDALKPLMQQSTAGLRAFGAQGQNVLHGVPYNQGLPTVGADGGVAAPSGTSFNDVLRQYYGAGRGSSSEGRSQAGGHDSGRRAQRRG